MKKVWYYQNIGYLMVQRMKLKGVLKAYKPVLRIRIRSFWVTRIRIRKLPDPDPLFKKRPL